MFAPCALRTFRIYLSDWGTFYLEKAHMIQLKEKWKGESAEKEGPRKDVNDLIRVYGQWNDTHNRIHQIRL